MDVITHEIGMLDVLMDLESLRDAAQNGCDHDEPAVAKMNASYSSGLSEVIADLHGCYEYCRMNTKLDLPASSYQHSVSDYDRLENLDISDVMRDLESVYESMHDRRNHSDWDIRTVNRDYCDRLTTIIQQLYACDEYYTLAHGGF